jgi:hypothetical protein
MRTILASCLTILVTACSSSVDEDPFIGTFESESRANFGTDTPGEWRIEVVYLSKMGKYEATLYRRGTLIGKNLLVYCSEDKENYLRNRPPGHAEVLCEDDKLKFFHGFLSYAKNGIYVGSRHYSAKYYAHAQWGFYGFRKVSP